MAKGEASALLAPPMVAPLPALDSVNAFHATPYKYPWGNTVRQDHNIL